MAAADVLVENAGGLTSMEALSVGLPIISYKPIAGHGKENTAEMDEAGVSRVAHSSQDLLGLLDRVSTPGPERMGMIKAGWAMFRSDPADHVLDLAADGVTAPVPVVALRPAPRRPSVLVARMAAAIAAVPLLWAGNIPGQEIEYPMALVILGGLVVATFANLFVVPSLYLACTRGRRDR